jgi:hypothetical protein
MNGRGKQRARVVVCAVVVVSIAGSSVGPAAAVQESNSAPLADAGLDRDVAVNGTVYLDATGSYDPDGRITGYDWEVQKPDGTYTDPVCGSCARTEFVVRESGTYNVTVTVTDDDGARRSDTLRVNAAAAEGPSVTVDGPTNVVANESVNFTATLTAGDQPLSRIDWHLGSGLEDRRNLDGSNETTELTVEMDAGEHTIEVEVYDEFGRTETATMNVSAYNPVARGGGSDSGTNGGAEQEEACSRYGTGNDHYCDNDMLIREGTERDITLIDVSNDGEITWNDETLNVEELENHPGVDVGSTGNKISFESRDAYADVTGSWSLNPDGESVSPAQSNDDDTFSGGDNGGHESHSKSQHPANPDENGDGKVTLDELRDDPRRGPPIT